MERLFFPRDVECIHWQRPLLPYHFPLDDFIELLAKRSRPPKLRSKTELTAIRPDCGCPYLLARTYAFMAATAAEVESVATPRRWKAGVQVSSINQRIHRQLGRAIRDLEPLGSYATVSARALERAADILERESAIITSDVDELPDRRGGPDLWKIAFVEVLGYCWYLLTKRAPSAGPGEASFVHFVESAFNSIDPEICEIWESSIKTALALVMKRPPNNRWNRWEFMK